jgi:hypothetical protein
MLFVNMVDAPEEFLKMIEMSILFAKQIKLKDYIEGMRNCYL